MPDRPAPSVGRIVHYKMSEEDAVAVQHRRTAHGTTANMTGAGRIHAAVVVATWGGDLVNLQVLLDGPDAYWTTSRHEGNEPGTWSWPERV